MHFVVDAQLPPGLVRILAEKGHTAEHVFDRFSPNVTDAEIWQYALSCGGVIISKPFAHPCIFVVSSSRSQLDTWRDQFHLREVTAVTAHIAG